MKGWFVALLSIVSITALAEDATCQGRIPNPVTDYCWSSPFLMTIANQKVMIQEQEDVDSVTDSNPVCVCTNPPKVGITAGFWEPTRLAEVVRTPYCFSALGAVKLNPGIQAPGHAQVKKPGPTKSAFYNVHWYTDSSFELNINNNTVCRAGKSIKKGIVAWNVFKDETDFINSAWYADEKMVAALRSIMLLRDNTGKSGAGDLKYFLSGRLFQHAKIVRYNGQEIQSAQAAFTGIIPDKSIITWGIGFSDNNKNQFRVNYLGADSFALLNRYPVSYPLAEEKRNDWSPHTVSKFLVADSKDLLEMPVVFGEGFLFAAFNGDSSIDFSPVLLSYKKGKANAPLNLQAKFLNSQAAAVVPSKDKSDSYRMLLPGASSGFRLDVLHPGFI